MQKFLLTDEPVHVFVDILEYFPDFVLTVLLVLQKGSDFVIGDGSRVIDVEIGKGLFEMVLI